MFSCYFRIREISNLRTLEKSLVDCVVLKKNWICETGHGCLSLSRNTSRLIPTPFALEFLLCVSPLYVILDLFSISSSFYQMSIVSLNLLFLLLVPTPSHPPITLFAYGLISSTSTWKHPFICQRKHWAGCYCGQECPWLNLGVLLLWAHPTGTNYLIWSDQFRKHLKTFLFVWESTDADAIVGFTTPQGLQFLQYLLYLGYAVPPLIGLWFGATWLSLGQEHLWLNLGVLLLWAHPTRTNYLIWSD